MWPDRVSNPGPLTYESGALPTALCGPAAILKRPHPTFLNFQISIFQSLCFMLNEC